MTRFFFNREEFTSHVTPEMDMEEIFQTLNNLHDDREVFISSILIDGEDVDFEKIDPSTITSVELQKAEKVEIFEASETMVLLSAFVEIYDYLGKIPSLFPDLLSRLKDNPGKETFENLSDFLENIQFMLMLFNTFYKMYPHYSEKEASQLNKRIKEMLDIFQKIISYQQQGNALLVSNILEFDLGASLDFFREAISSINDFLLRELDNETGTTPDTPTINPYPEE